ncbi:MAG: hypothetical protein ACFFFT_05035 [Candidatus Thorarchaeota archaeon]
MIITATVIIFFIYYDTHIDLEVEKQPHTLNETEYLSSLNNLENFPSGSGMF